MNKIILILFSLLLSVGANAGSNDAPTAKNLATPEAVPKETKSVLPQIWIFGDLKCAHCDLKIGDSCAPVIQSQKRNNRLGIAHPAPYFPEVEGETGLYFLKGSIAKRFSKQDPKPPRVQAIGFAKKSGDAYILRVTSILDWAKLIDPRTGKRID